MHIQTMMPGGKPAMHVMFVAILKPAMLVVGGLFDAEDCFGAWNLYKATEKQNPIIINKL